MSEQQEKGSGRFSRGLQYMVLSAFFFSIMSVGVKLAGRQMDSQQIVLARAAIALLLCIITIKHLGIPFWGSKENRHLLIMRGVFGFIALSCFFYTVTVLPLADATVIQYTNPVFVTLFAAIFLKERISPFQILGLLGCLAGVACIAQPSFLFGGEGVARLDPLAVGLALVGAVLAGGAYTVVRSLSGREHAMVVVFYFPLVATPLAIPTAWPVLSMPDAWGWACLLAVGVSTQIAQVFLTKGLHLEKAGPATSITYLQIVFAFLWGMLLFGETPTLLSGIGTLLVVGSSLIAAMADKKGARRASRSS